MNSNRAQFSVAVLISFTVHGVLVSIGGVSAEQGAKATNIVPVAVTIASVAEAAVQPPDPRPQESNTAVAEAAKTEDSVPAEVIPEQAPPVQSSIERPNTPKLESEPARPVETVAPAAQQSIDTAPADELTGGSKTDTIAQIPMPERPDVTAVPLYHLIPKPAYPSRSRDLGEEGRVIIAVLISEDGSVLEAYVSETSGYPLLDGSALATVTKRWRFKPGTRRGKAVPSWVRVPIKFSIKGG